MLRRYRQLAIVWDEISWNWRENRKYTFLSLHKQPFITAQSPVITAHFVYHCKLFYALAWTTMAGKLFQELTTRWMKKNFLVSSLDLILTSFLSCPLKTYQVVAGVKNWLHKWHMDQSVLGCVCVAMLVPVSIFRWPWRRLSIWSLNQEGKTKHEAPGSTLSSYKE